MSCKLLGIDLKLKDMLMKPNPLNGSQKGLRLVKLFGHEIQEFLLPDNLVYVLCFSYMFAILIKFSGAFKLNKMSGK